MRVATTFILLCVSALALVAQSSGRRLPRFEDYPAVQYKGPLAAPRIVSPLHRKYRGVLRGGVAKGWGVYHAEKGETGQERPGPNFAGNMIVIWWGCGVPCNQRGMVDGRTGIVYQMPITYQDTGDTSLTGFNTPWLTNGFWLIPAEYEFRLGSRLMIVKWTAPVDAPAPSFTSYYVWQSGRWTLLRKMPLKLGDTPPD